MRGAGGSRAPYLLFDLGGCQFEVDEGCRSARLRDGVVGDDPVDAVFGTDLGAVAFLQAKRDEASGGLAVEGVQLGPGDASLALDVGEVVGEALGGEGKVVGNGLRQDGCGRHVGRSIAAEMSRGVERFELSHDAGEILQVGRRSLWARR